MLRKKAIKFTWKKMRDFWGMAYPEEWRFEIDPRLDDERTMNTGIHESLHVLFPRKGEATVTWAGDHITHVLRRLGFRRCSCCTSEDDE